MKEVTEKRDPRILIAALVNMVYSYNGGYVRELSTNSYQSISLGESGTNRQGNLRYYNNKVWQYSDMWEEIANETLRESFKTLHEVIGDCTLRIFRQFPTITKQIYDIVCAPVTFTDSNAPSGYQTVEGGLTIHMYNGSDWEVLQESQQSLIQNLSGYVRAVAYKRAGEYSTAAGFITSTDWATLFAQAETDGRVVARSEISAFITKVSDGNGGYVMESGVRISANNIDLTGTDSISLAISNVASNQKQYSPNLLPNSIINETSVAYGFGNRSLKLENGKTYTLSASGIVPTSLPSNMVLKVFIYRLKDSGDTSDTSEIGVKWASNSASLNITKNSGAAKTASVSITTDRTGTYYISSYLYDLNEEGGSSGAGNSGTRTYPVTLLWYKVEEGSTATPWVANDNDERHVDNYIMNPLAISATKEVNSDFSSSEVTDNEYGKVLQVSHTVNGHWQLTFTRRSTYAQLTNNHATFYVICKALNGYDGYSNGNRTRLCFGYDNNGTRIMVDTLESSFIDLGNGWRKYYSVNKMDLALGSTVGICHVMGSWQIYAVGIVAGGVCPTMAEIMASNSLLKTGIDLTAGKIELRADKVMFTSSDGTVTNKISIDPTTGTLHATDANISGTINATAGNIGGWSINEYGLYNNNGNAGITLNYNGRKAIIGGEVTSANTLLGIDACAKFENKAPGNIFNMGVIVDVQNAVYNRALDVKGITTFNGIAEHWPVSKMSFTAANQIFVLNDQTKQYYIKAQRIFITTNYSGDAILLPALSWMREILGLLSTDEFTYRLTYIANSQNTNDLKIYGRNTSQGSGSYDTNDYPYRCGKGSRVAPSSEGGFTLVKGEVVDFILCYHDSVYEAYQIEER